MANTESYPERFTRDPTVDRTTPDRIMKEKIYNFESIPILSIFRPKNIVP